MAAVIRARWVILCFASLLPAQRLPTQPSPPVLVDTVVATVNDGAIMWSELRTVAMGQIRTAEAQHGRLTREDVDRIQRRELQGLIDRHTMAQAAKTFGVATPEQVEAYFLREIERQEQDQVRDFGSYQAFSQALQNQGRTWQTYMREQRVDKMADLAEDLSVRMRMQRQANLFLTPRMLRETYQREKGRFVHGAEARVAIVVFTGKDAAETAAKAAEVWRVEDVTSRALAQRYPDAIAVDDAPASALVPELASFALEGPLLRVSEPLARGGDFQVAKVVAYNPARSGSFEDIDVQNELRNLCQAGVHEEFRKQALERARQRAEVWIAAWAR